jgi:hypothetical protein
MLHVLSFSVNVGHARTYPAIDDCWNELQGQAFLWQRSSRHLPKDGISDLSLSCTGLWNSPATPCAQPLKIPYN